MTRLDSLCLAFAFLAYNVVLGWLYNNPLWIVGILP